AEAGVEDVGVLHAWSFRALAASADNNCKAGAWPTTMIAGRGNWKVASAAHGSRRALRALLTMRLSVCCGAPRNDASVVIANLKAHSALILRSPPSPRLRRASRLVRRSPKGEGGRTRAATDSLRRN